PVGRRRYCFTSVAERPLAGSWSPCSTSGSRSTSFGQTIVPATESTATWAKKAGSDRGSKTPPHSPTAAAKSSSRTSPSENVRRKRCSPRCSTSTTRASRLMASRLLEGVNGHEGLHGLRSLPVRHEFFAVEVDPVLHEP